MMKIVASQSYVIVKRSIDWNIQRTIEEEQHLILYEKQVVSATDIFPLEEVWDISFKRLSSEAGLLYLHTNKGVFPYQVKANPSSFMEKFRGIKSGFHL